MSSSSHLPPREPQATFSILSRLVTPTILFLTSLTVALGVSYSVLAADILAYAVSEAKDSNYYMIEVQTWWKQGDAAREIFPGVMEYTPKHLELGGLKAVMAAGMVSAVGSLAVAVLWVLRALSAQRQAEDQEGVVKPKLTWISTTSVAIITLTFLLTLITAALTATFQADGRPPTGIFYPGYFSPSLSGTWNESSPNFAVSTYNSPVHYNPVAWNCQITTVLGYTYPAGDVRRLCREGGVMWDLMVPEVVLQAIVVGLLGWVVVGEWKARRAVRTQMQ